MTASARVREDESLRPALLRLDLRLRQAVATQRDQLTERARDPFRGLYISEADVDELLESVPSAEIAHRFYGTPVAELSPRLGRLADLFDLDEFDQEVVLVCLAPDVDLRYERLYAYLQDDVTRRRPTVDLILQLLATTDETGVSRRDALSPGGRLLQQGLLSLSDDAAAGWPLLARPLRVDERIVEYLLGSDRVDPRIATFARLEEAPRLASPNGQIREIPARLAGLVNGHHVRHRQGAGVGPVVYVSGPATSGKVAAVREARRYLGRAVLTVDLAALLAGSKPPPAPGFAYAAREALLRDAILCVVGFDHLLDDDENASLRGFVRTILTQRRGPTFLIGEKRWEPSDWLPDVQAIRIDLPPLSPEARRQLWRTELAGHLPIEDIDGLAARFRLDGDAIRAVETSARLRADWRGSADVTFDDYRAAAGALAAPSLDGLAVRVEPRYGWSDIVLSTDNLAQLHELCDRARFTLKVHEQWGFGRKHARRQGLTALFAGQPGTGKTMAAEIVAGGLGLELFRIDLAAVVSKYIGETEKNLERIFRAADRGDAVLLFDEADAIFGKRSEVRDAHDRYANVETAYLLQRLEAYDGLAVLTTNLRGNIDEAFVRRLDFVLEFPMPEEPERLAIWRLAIPPEAPVDDGVDLGFMARKFRLAGGHIRNIALAAAFLAAADRSPIGMKHLVRATRREHQKLGRMVAAGDFEHYFGMLKD